MALNSFLAFYAGMGWLFRLGLTLQYSLGITVLFLVVGYVFRIENDFVGLLSVPAFVVIFAFIFANVPDNEQANASAAPAHSAAHKAHGPDDHQS